MTTLFPEADCALQLIPVRYYLTTDLFELFQFHHIQDIVRNITGLPTPVERLPPPLLIIFQHLREGQK